MGMDMEYVRSSRLRRRKSVMLVALAGLVLSACGGDAEDPAIADASGSPAAGPGTPAENLEPFNIGYISDLSGPLRDMYAPGAEGFQLYFKTLNEAGGIDGRPVEVHVRDDESNAERSAVLARELIDRSAVNSIWGLGVSSTHGPVNEVGRNAEVPVISSPSGISEALPPAQDFTYSVGNVFDIYGEAAGFLAPDVADGGLAMCVTIETPGGFAACGHASQAAEEGGFDTDELFFPPATVEFGAVAQEAASADPSVIISTPAGHQVSELLRALRSTGYENPYMALNIGVDENALVSAMEAAGNFENTYVMSRYQLPDDEGPEIEAFRAAAEADGMTVSGAHVYGWVLGMVAEGALRDCGFPCSATDMDATLQQLSVDVGQLSGGPIGFSEDDHHGQSWWKLYEYDAQEERFVSVSDWLELESTPVFTVE